MFEPSTVVLAKMFQRVGGKLPIIGVGGISSGETAWQKVRAGAGLLQLYSALVYKGPALIHEICGHLADRLQVLINAWPSAEVVLLGDGVTTSHFVTLDFEDEQILCNGMVSEPDQDVGVPRIINHPIQITSVPRVGHRPAPALGEHSVVVLDELVYGADDIARLRRDGVFVEPPGDDA